MKTTLYFLLIIVSPFISFSQKEIGKRGTTSPSVFNFIALGDMPYNLPTDYAQFEKVISTINNLNPQFSLFVGDFKASKTICSDEVFQKILTYFNQFQQPLIYTPGDNEWTDCHQYGDVVFNPEERLDYLRKSFFNDSLSLGIQKMKLTSESKIPEFKKYIENKYWSFNTVSFATIHIVGSNNNFYSESENFNKEFYDRSKANIYWLNQLFQNAKKQNDLGIVITTHADMFTADKGSTGFSAFLKELQRLTIDFGKPVLLINGDSHQFKIDKPFQTAQRECITNFTRLQVFGESDMHAVKITINPLNPNLFEIQEVIIPKN